MKSTDNTKFRNIAIIAHVDHGKTTLVDCMLNNSGLKVSNERAMDSIDLEQERGITILSKCTAINYKNHKINIVDTPGHADFGGEVERIMTMVDGVCLVVCATEGPMPQTKFVLMKALQRGLKLIIVINKVDRETARVKEVENEVFDLFCTLDANDSQLDYPIVYASAKNGWATKELGVQKDNVEDLLETIVNTFESPKNDQNTEFSMLVTQSEHDNHFGKMLIGKIESGTLKLNDKVDSYDQDGKLVESGKIMKIVRRCGVYKLDMTEAVAGDIVSIAGMNNSTVTNTIVLTGTKKVIPSVKIDPPMISILIMANDSPLQGKEGTKWTFNELRDRLIEESRNDVSLRVEFDQKKKDAITVYGRGDLHLGVLIEKMRREGFEMSVTPPQVIYKVEKGKKLEPVEHVTIEIADEFVSLLSDQIINRKGEMKDNKELPNNRMIVEFEAPTRGLFGFRPFFIQQTKGNVVIQSKLKGYEPYKGPIKAATNGAILSMAGGVASAYSLKDVEKHGLLYITPGTPCYCGMVIGELNKADGEMDVNPCKEKPTSNVRAAGKEDFFRLSPPKVKSLEDIIVNLRPDELLEATPVSLRIRKVILDKDERKRLIRDKKYDDMLFS